jgi:hypothetical protein
MLGSKVRFVLMAVFVYFLAVAIYVLAWQDIVSGAIPSSSTAFSQPNLSFSGSNQTVPVSAVAEMVVYRYGFLPVYWSRIGDLTAYHTAFFSLSAVCLLAACILKLRKTSPKTLEGEGGEFRLIFAPKPEPKPKILKPNPPIPKGGGTLMPKQEKKTNPKSRVILTLWALMGFVWFIVYQLLPVIPYDLSLAIVETLNLSMWVLAVASAALILIPYLKVLYVKIWEEGGEKRHE